MRCRYDSLSGLANSRFFLRVLEKEIESVGRSGDSTLLLMLEVGYFKKVNDTHGHHAGDVVLQAAAECIRKAMEGLSIPVSPMWWSAAERHPHPGSAARHIASLSS